MANKTGKGGFKDNPKNRNTAGQRSREVVATAAQARALYVQLLHEPHGAPLPDEISNLEVIVRQHVAAAKKGDATAREQMFDRIWGKALQPIGGPDGDAIKILVEYADAENNTSEIA